MSISGKKQPAKSKGAARKPAAWKKAATAARAKPAAAKKPAAETRAKAAARAAKIAAILAREYPDARCLLTYQTPFQLLISTILAAQCTDERVNMVAPALYARFPDPASMAGA